jgi:hypothetical protein
MKKFIGFKSISAALNSHRQPARNITTAVTSQPPNSLLFATRKDTLEELARRGGGNQVRGNRRRA